MGLSTFFIFGGMSFRFSRMVPAVVTFFLCSPSCHGNVGEMLVHWDVTTRHFGNRWKTIRKVLYVFVCSWDRELWNFVSFVIHLRLTSIEKWVICVRHNCITKWGVQKAILRGITRIILSESHFPAIHV